MVHIPSVSRSLELLCTWNIPQTWLVHFLWHNHIPEIFLVFVALRVYVNHHFPAKWEVSVQVKTHMVVTSTRFWNLVIIPYNIVDMGISLQPHILLSEETTFLWADRNIFITSNSHWHYDKCNGFKPIQTRFGNIGQRVRKTLSKVLFLEKFPPAKLMINSTFNSFPKTGQEGN